jgi:hypothetical protein
MARTCIDKIQEWIEYLGPNSSDILRKQDDELIVTRKLPRGDKYKLHIWEDYDNTVVFQSLAFKAPSGRANDELNFFQTLLMYNGLLDYASFALTEIEPKGQWGTTLNSIHDCKRLNAAYVAEIVRSFDKAYIEFVPMLKSMARQLQLDFTGRRGVLTNNIPYRGLDEE